MNLATTYSWVYREWVVSHSFEPDQTLDIELWFQNVKTAMGPPSDPSPLALVILDVKTPTGPLLGLYLTARAILGPDINLIISINDYAKRERFDELKGVVGADQRLGLAIDFLTGSDNQEAIRQFFSAGNFPRYWYADGYAAELSAPASVKDNLQDGQIGRDNFCESAPVGGSSAFHGVYTWTYEKQTGIREYLNFGVNAIMVNAPQCIGYSGSSSIWQPKDVVAFAEDPARP